MIPKTHLRMKQIDNVNQVKFVVDEHTSCMYIKPSSMISGMCVWMIQHGQIILALYYIKSVLNKYNFNIELVYSLGCFLYSSVSSEIFNCLTSSLA